MEEIDAPIEFVSAADGTNVVKIFHQALEMGLNYKKNPHEDDFMNDVLDLLDDTKPKGVFGKKVGGAANSDDFFWYFSLSPNWLLNLAGNLTLYLGQRGSNCFFFGIVTKTTHIN